MPRLNLQDFKSPHFFTSRAAQHGAGRTRLRIRSCARTERGKHLAVVGIAESEENLVGDQEWLGTPKRKRSNDLD
jgi:hypothetical protein